MAFKEPVAENTTKSAASPQDVAFVSHNQLYLYPYRKT